MSRSEERPSLGPVVARAFLRTIYGYVLVAVVGLAFPALGLQRFAAGWYWLLIPALVLTALYTVSYLSRPVAIAEVRDRREPEDSIRLDNARRAYLDDALKRREIIHERLDQVKDHSSVGQNVSSTVAELDRLIPELERLLKRNLRLETDIRRLESGVAARPSQESLRELKDLYGRQWDVVKRVTDEIATIDANVAVVINQIDSGEDAVALESAARDWSAKLGYWKQGIREVYGAESGAAR